MASNAVYVITGANRGIGLGLVGTYLARPSTTVVGVVRNDPAAISLKIAAEKVVKGTNSYLHVIQVDFSAAGSPESIRDRFLAATGGLGHVNTLIYSAGHVTPMVPTVAIAAEHLRECFEINTIGPLIAF
jgi:NAD(P)-dependent dehydrogenase (short-subunit alcohol dehydrogenase family)